MNYFTSLEDLNQYRQFEGLSQSFLKLILSNNVNKKFKETVPLLIGSYLDSLLTSPDLTDDLFQVGLAKRPSDAIMEIIKEHFEMMCSVDSVDMLGDFESQRELLMRKVREKGYQPKWGDDAVWNSIVKDGQGYWEELVSSQGKVLITQEGFENCQNIAQLTCSSSITGKYFQDQEDIDKYYQMPLYWTYEGLLCKGLLDILIFEKETKTIYIVDIKSTGVGTLKEWFQVCRSKNYLFQMSWYREGVIANYPELIEDGWKIECRWIVIPTGFFKPWVVPCTDLMLKFGKEGYYREQRCYYSEGFFKLDTPVSFTIKQEEYIPGFEEAIRRYKKKEQEGLLDYDIEYYETKGKLDNSQAEQYYFT